MADPFEQALIKYFKEFVFKDRDTAQYRFVELLKNYNRLYHFDDDPSDILNLKDIKLFTNFECILLRDIVDTLMVTEADNERMFGYLIKAQGE